MNNAILLDLLKSSGASKKLLSSIALPNNFADYFNYELVSLPNKSKNAGVLLFQINGDWSSFSYRLTRAKVISAGRLKPVLCDFCYTWLTAGDSALVTFDKKNKKSHTFYCCAALNCSKNVRDLTKVSELSRTQLKENLSKEDRILRLKLKITKVIAIIGE